MNAYFSCPQTNRNLTISSVSNNNYISAPTLIPGDDNQNYEFMWAPLTTSLTTFTFTYVTGIPGPLTSNGILPGSARGIYQCTVNVSPTTDIPVGTSQTMTATFSCPQPTTPILELLKGNTMTQTSLVGPTDSNFQVYTFQWTPISSGSTTFTIASGIPTSSITSNSVNVIDNTPSCTGTTVTISPTTGITVGTSQTMTATFTCSQITTPVLAINNNNISLSTTDSNFQVYTFLWTPTSSGPTTFTFTGVTGVPGGSITSNSVNVIDNTPSCTDTTVTVSPITGITVGTSQTMTATFTCPQTTTPVLSDNIPVSTMDPNFQVYTFPWTPTSPGSATFTFTGVTGVSGGSITSNLVNVIDNTLSCTNTTVTVSPTTIIVGSNTNITATFSCPQLSDITITINMPDDSSNEFISPVLNNTICNFLISPTSPGFINIIFKNVTGAIDNTLISNATAVINNNSGQPSSCQSTTTNITITPPAIVTVGQEATMSVTFGCLQSISSMPIVSVSNNGSITSQLSTNSPFTFGWTPLLTSPSPTFIFTNLDGTNNSVTVPTSITISPAISSCTNTTVTVSPTTGIIVGTSQTMTATFTCPQTITLTLSNNIPLSSTDSNLQIYTFSWTPISSGPTTFTFTGVTGVLGGSITSNSVNVINNTPSCTGTMVTIIPTTGIIVGTVTKMTVIFNTCLQTNTPIISNILNYTGTLPQLNGTGPIYTFNWTPTRAGSTLITFTGVTGVQSVLTSDPIFVINSVPLPEDEVTNYNFIQDLYYNHNVYFILIVTFGSIFIVIFIIIILYFIFRHKKSPQDYF